MRGARAVGDVVSLISFSGCSRGDRGPPPGAAIVVEELAALRARAEKTRCDVNREYNPGWHTALDLKNLLIVSEAIARSAEVRKESRGGHFREDFPARDDKNWFKWINIEQEVRLNDPGAQNGHLRVWVDGKLHMEDMAQLSGKMTELLFPVL